MFLFIRTLPSCLLIAVSLTVHCLLLLLGEACRRLHACRLSRMYWQTFRSFESRENLVSMYAVASLVWSGQGGCTGHPIKSTIKTQLWVEQWRHPLKEFQGGGHGYLQTSSRHCIYSSEASKEMSCYPLVLLPLSFEFC